MNTGKEGPQRERKTLRSIRAFLDFQKQNFNKHRFYSYLWCIIIYLINDFLHYKYNIVNSKVMYE